MTSSRTIAGVLFLFLLVAATAVGSVAQQGPPPARAIPLDAITGVIDAFRTHSVVALQDAHGDAQAHAFLLSLVRNPRLAPTVDDIVVSVGNARYQDVMDWYVRGEQVAYDSLRAVWRNTTAENLSGDLPTHEELFHTVRMVNAALPRERQLRVLLADPPIDWDKVRSPADYRKWRDMRASYAAALIQVEVLARERRALLVHSFLELQRKNLFLNYDMQDRRAQTVVSLLESATPIRVFTIWGSSGLASLRTDVGSWRIPSLAIVRSTELGAADFMVHFREAPRVMLRDGKPVPVPREQWRPLRAEDQFDAVLYLGPSSSEIGLSPAICTEPGYVEMRLKRLAVAGLPPPLADELTQHCATARGR